MPERDFELYLSLLSRFLRLKPAQHAEIADELRDHLEQRLEELTARGLSHDEAIRRALDELGDAAELAHHFTRATHIRRRRLIMRCTLGTIGTVAAALLFTTAFWPEASQAPLPARGIAQEARTAVVEAEPTASPRESRIDLEAKLKTRLTEINFLETSLVEVAQFFSEKLGIDILFDKPALQDEGIAIETPVTLELTRNPVEAGLALKLILEPLQLGYHFRDNIVVITTSQKLADVLEIRVYNVRDLLAPNDSASVVGNPGLGGGGFGGGGGFFGINSLLPLAAFHLGQGVEKKPAAGARQRRRSAPGIPQADDDEDHPLGRLVLEQITLSSVITHNVEPVSWDEVGGSGSISQYNGLLVVNQTEAVHTKIRDLLKLMRQSLQETDAVPGVKEQAAGGQGKTERRSEGEAERRR